MLSVGQFYSVDCNTTTSDILATATSTSTTAASRPGLESCLYSRMFGSRFSTGVIDIMKLHVNCMRLI